MMRDDTVLGRYNGLVILRLEMMVTDAIACSKNTVDTRPSSCRYCHRPFVYELDPVQVPFGHVMYVSSDVCGTCQQASDYCPLLG
jgi:hypothetical protein